MEHLVSCDRCGHSAIVHEPAGCSSPKCACGRTLPSLIDEALEAVRLDIKREWDSAS